MIDFQTTRRRSGTLPITTTSPQAVYHANKFSALSGRQEQIAPRDLYMIQSTHSALEHCLKKWGERVKTLSSFLLYESEPVRQPLAYTVLRLVGEHYIGSGQL